MARAIRGAVVVITGASSGIGRAAALAFAGEGAKLVLAGRDRPALGEVARLAGERGAEAVACETDVTVEAAVERLRDTAIARFGRIDVWVNDAAVHVLGRLEEVPAEAFRRVLETNVLGVVHGAQAALARFRQQGTGVLVNIGSLAGHVPYAYASAYSASKHAVVALTEALRQELAGTDIHACLVAPATVDTPLFQHAANYTGRSIRAMPPIYDAEQVAEAIVAVAKRPRREAKVGLAPRVMSALAHAAPGIYERNAQHSFDRRHFGSEPARTAPVTSTSRGRRTRSAAAGARRDIGGARPSSRSPPRCRSCSSAAACCAAAPSPGSRLAAGVGLGRAAGGGLRTQRAQRGEPVGAHPVHVDPPAAGVLGAGRAAHRLGVVRVRHVALGEGRHVDAGVGPQHRHVEHARPRSRRAPEHARRHVLDRHLVRVRREEGRQIDVARARVRDAVVARLAEDQARRRRAQLPHRLGGLAGEQHDDLERVRQRQELTHRPRRGRGAADQPLAPERPLGGEGLGEPRVVVELELDRVGGDRGHEARDLAERGAGDARGGGAGQPLGGGRRGGGAPGVVAEDVHLGRAPRLEDVVEGVAEVLQVADLAPVRLAAVELLAERQITVVLLAAPADLVVELVRILDEVLEALGVRRREAVEPDVDVGPARVGERRLQVRQVLGDVVEEVLARLRPGVAERDDVEEVELLDAPADEGVEHLGQVPDVLLVDDDVDVDDEPLRRERRLEPRGLVLERAGRAHEGVVDLGVVAVEREGDLVEPVLRRRVEELGVLEHPAVGHGLDLAVAGALAELHEVEEVRVHRRLAAGEDEPLGPALLALDDLDLDVHVGAHRAVVRVRVEAEGAVVVAVVGEAHPVALLVGRVLVRERLVVAEERVVLEVGEPGRRRRVIDGVGLAHAVASAPRTAKRRSHWLDEPRSTSRRSRSSSRRPPARAAWASASSRRAASPAPSLR